MPEIELNAGSPGPALEAARTLVTRHPANPEYRKLLEQAKRDLAEQARRLLPADGAN